MLVFVLFIGKKVEFRVIVFFLWLFASRFDHKAL